MTSIVFIDGDKNLPTGILQEEVFVNTPIATSPGTSFSLIGIPWAMSEDATRAITVVVTGNTGRTGDPSVTLRNAADSSTVAEFETQYLYKATPTNTTVILIATVRVPIGSSHSVRINTPGSNTAVRDMTIGVYSTLNMDSFEPVRSYFSRSTEFTDQFTNHQIATKKGGFVIGAIRRADQPTSPYPDPMYNYDPSWISASEHLVTNASRRIIIRGVSPDRKGALPMVFDRKTTKECIVEEVHMISLR